MRVLSRDTVAAGLLAVALTGGTVFLYWLVTSRQPVPERVSPATMAVASLLTVAGCATVAARSRWPFATAGLATALILVCVALDRLSFGPTVGLVVGAYTVGARYAPRTALPGLGLLAAAHAIGGAALGGNVDGLLSYWDVPGDNPASLAFASAASFGIPAGIGTLARRRRAEAAALTARAERLEAEREARDRAAAAAERTRIGMELHDIAAHDLSAIVVQAGAADRLVDSDPAAAKAVLRDIRGQGRQTLTALRHLAGIMRESEPDGGDRTPQPGLARVEDLLAVERAAGATIHMTETGQACPLPSMADLAAYRILQEALTNARRHAPGAPVTVAIVHDGGVRIEVRNGPPRRLDRDGVPSTGHGLAGMRERVRQAGGTLMYGPVTGGGWMVAARLPADRP